MLARLFLFATVLQCAACAGVYLPPAANVPALRQAGQATVGVSARTFAPYYAAHATAAVAVNDWLRVAGTVSGRFRERRGLYGEALVGGEPRINKVLQLGVLAGVGYGDVDAEHPKCDDGPGICLNPGNHVDQARATYMRYSLQAYAVVYAPKIVHGGGGVRLSLMDMHLNEIDDVAVERHAFPIAIEPFAFARLGLPFFQPEIQFRYTGVTNSPRDLGRKVIAVDHFTMMFGVRFVFGPGIERRWPRGWKYDAVGPRN